MAEMKKRRKKPKTFSSAKRKRRKPAVKLAIRVTNPKTLPRQAKYAPYLSFSTVSLIKLCQTGVAAEPKEVLRVKRRIYKNIFSPGRNGRKEIKSQRNAWRKTA